MITHYIFQVSWGRILVCQPNERFQLGLTQRLEKCLGLVHAKMGENGAYIFYWKSLKKVVKWSRHTLDYENHDLKVRFYGYEMRVLSFINVI